MRIFSLWLIIKHPAISCLNFNKNCYKVEWQSWFLYVLLHLTEEQFSSLDKLINQRVFLGSDKEFWNSHLAIYVPAGKKMVYYKREHKCFCWYVPQKKIILINSEFYSNSLEVAFCHQQYKCCFIVLCIFMTIHKTK